MSIWWRKSMGETRASAEIGESEANCLEFSQTSTILDLSSYHRCWFARSYCSSAEGGSGL